MEEVISADVLDWARDLRFIQDLLAASEPVAIALQFHDHDQLSNPNHRMRPHKTEAAWADTKRSGEFLTPTFGEHSPGGHTRSTSAVVSTRARRRSPARLGSPPAPE